MSFYKNINFKDVKNQFITVACANLLAMSHGGLMGWFSPAILILQSDQSPVGKLSTSDASWLGSVSFLGAFVGGIILLKLIRLLGRKTTFCILAVPNFSFWIIIIYAQKVELLMFARVLGGLVGGGMYVAIPLLVGEIAEPQVRGILGSALMIFGALGTMLAYITGTFMTYHTSPLVMMLLPLSLFISFLILPDTPISLVLKNKHPKDVEKSLKFYLNCYDTSSERYLSAVDRLNAMADLINNKKSLSFKEYFEKDALIGLVKGLCMVSLSIFCGSTVLQNYASIVFKNSGSKIDPSLSSIVMICVQFLSATVSTVLVDKIGRRPLLISSSFGTALGLACMGGYTYSKFHGNELKGLDWVPLASICFTVFSAYVGLLPLIFVVLLEVLPPKVRDGYTTFCLSLTGLCMFIVVKLYPIAAEAYQMHSCFWFFSTVSFLGLIFGVFILEETKGKDISVNNYNK